MSVPVVCRTNLDVQPGEQWPAELPFRPVVGDRIQSATKWGVFQLTLKVVRVTFRESGFPMSGGRREWYAEVELHDCWPEPRSISDFHRWYDAARRPRNDHP